jgi:hypothetical protein
MLQFTAHLVFINQLQLITLMLRQFMVHQPPHMSSHLYKMLSTHHLQVCFGFTCFSFFSILFPRVNYPSLLISSTHPFCYTFHHTIYIVTLVQPRPVVYAPAPVYQQPYAPAPVVYTQPGVVYQQPYGQPGVYYR